jgi:hypothetical protein
MRKHSEKSSETQQKPARRKTKKAAVPQQPTRRRLANSALGASGTLRKIFNLFMKPLFKDMIVKDDMFLDEHEFTSKLNLWFDAKHREIFFCEVLETFRITGTRWAAKDQPHAPLVTGVTSPEIRRGTAVWVRVDARRPDIVELETEGHMYMVPTVEFNSVIKDKLKELC